MARKSGVKPEEITRWLNRVKSAESLRQDADVRYGYSRAILEYQNDYMAAMPSWIADTPLVPINEVYAFTKAFVPSVYSRDPFVTVNPRGFKAIAGSKILELLVNAYWRELRLKRETRRVIIDAVLAEGWIKTGYAAGIEKTEGKPGLEASEFIRDEEIFASRVSWKNMVRDNDAVNGIHDARYVAELILRPLEAVKASSLYENTDDLRPAFLVDQNGRDRKPSESGEDKVEYAALWEIWDRDTERVYTVSEGSDKFLMNKKWPYKMEGFPYALLRFNENPDEAYAPNLIGSWEPQLWEKIKIRAMQLDHIKRFGRQMTIEKGAMTPADLQKLAMGITASVLERKTGMKGPEPIQYPPVQSDMYAIEGRIDLDKDNVSGQPNAVRSAPQRTQSRTLGEIDRLISSFQARQSEPQSVIEDFCEEVAYKIIKLSQQFLSGEKFVRATQKEIEEIAEALVDPETGESRFDGVGFKFSRKDIQGVEFEVNVKSGSTLPMDKQNRIESMVSILKLGPTIGIQPGGKVARVLGKNIMSEFDMKEVEQAYDEEMQEIEKAQILTNAAQQEQLRLKEEQIRMQRESGLAGLEGAVGGVQ